MKPAASNRRFLPILFAGWMWTMFVSRLLTIDQAEGGDKYVLFAALSWPLLLLPFVPELRKGLTAPALLSSKGFLVFLAAFSAANTLSIVASEDPFTAGAYFGSVIMALVLAYLITAALDDQQILAGLRIFSVIGAVAMLMYGTLSQLGAGDRLEGTLNANHVGYITISVILASLLHRNMATIILVSSPAVLVLYWTNSRAAMIAVIIGIALWFMIRSQAVPWAGLLTYGSVIAALVLIPLYFDEQGLKSILIATSDVFALDDPRRGLGTGATGRWDAWKEAWRLFLDNPVLGVGFRLHPTYMRHASYAHNGYLALLAECGLVGALPWIAFILHSLRRMASQVRRPLAAWSAALVTAYFFDNCFEGYMFTIGHPTTLLVFTLFVRYFTAETGDLPFSAPTGLEGPSAEFWANLRRKRTQSMALPPHTSPPNQPLETSGS